MHEQPFTVIIPAHNEAQVIERCLLAMSADTVAPQDMQVIVAANGCSDNTAQLARRVAPQAIVIEQEVGSKPRAMNKALTLATHSTCIFLDADVQCSFSSLAAVAKALNEPGVMAASPALRLDLAKSDALVKSYYKVWMNLPYITDRLVGSGCFGLSKVALERLGDFPEIIGDDIFIRSLFSYEERRNIVEDASGQPVFFEVSPPRVLSDQIRVEKRRRIGNNQVDQLLANQDGRPNHRGGNSMSDILNTRKRGASWFDIATYLGTKAAVILKAQYASVRGQGSTWERDIAARET